MPTDPLNAAVDRIDAAIAGDAPPQPGLAPPRDLAAVATALERAEALIAAAMAEERDRSSALERIADIAFVLHERDVEQSLCDALDAAVREISDAGALQRASAERTQEAAELLRELSRRVSELAADLQPEQNADTGVAAAAPAKPAPRPVSALHDGNGDEELSDDDIPRTGLFEEDVPEDDDFAQVVAALAAALPSLADMEELPDEPVEAADSAADVADAEPDLDMPIGAAAADEAPSAVTDAGQAIFASDVEVTLIVESSRSVLAGGEAVPLETPPGATAPNSENPCASVAAQDGTPTSEVTAEPLLNAAAIAEALAADEALSGAAPADPSPLSNPVTGTEGVSGFVAPDPAIEDGAPVEEAVAPEAEVSARASEAEASHQRQPVLEASRMDAAASAAEVTPLGDEMVSALAVAAPDLGASAILTDSGQPAELAVEGLAVQTGDTQPEALSPVELPAESQIDAFEPLAVDEEDIRASAGGEEPRALVAEPTIGPEDDPGDLFEPMPEAQKVSSAESAATVVEPEPGTTTPHAPHVADTAADSAWEPAGETQTTVSHAGQKPAAEMPASVLSRSAEADGKPPQPAPTSRPQPRTVPNTAAPRFAANDPLAPVRALSEEEMIALFS